MATIFETPKDILDLIAFSQEQRKLEVEQREETNAQQQSERNAAQRQRAEALFTSACELAFVPDCIRPFVKLEDVDITNDEHYNVQWGERVLEFHVPGLAPIAMVFCEDRQTEQPRLEDWIVAGIADANFDEDMDLCTTAVFSFGCRYQHKVNDANLPIHRLLDAAQQVAGDLIKRQKELELQWSVKVQVIAEREAEERKQVSEELSLFNAIKSDPIAVHLLKAFVLLRDERSTFEQQLYNLDELASSIENRWSRKASELRRMADDAQQRADDERNRLQSDIYDLESRLKKTERGW